MIIFIPFQPESKSGTATFVRNFVAGAKKQGHEVVFRFRRDFDRMLVIGDVPLVYYPLVVLAKLARRPIVQRLDGVHHPATPAGRWHWLWNLKAKVIHNYLADKIVYQSRFSQISCERFLGKTRGASTIIYNGVDLEKFKPSHKRAKSSSPIRLVTAALFRRRDQIEPLVRVMKYLGPTYRLSICGSYSDAMKPLVQETMADQRIRWKGPKSTQELAWLLPGHDIFIFADQSACPNVVLEAMAAGLPVVAFDRGSIGELVKSGLDGEVVPLGKHDQFVDPYPFQNRDYQLFAERVTTVADSLKRYRDQARKDVKKRFKLDSMMSRYLEVMR